MEENNLAGTIPPPPAGIDMSKFADYKKKVIGAGPIPAGVDMAKFSAYKANVLSKPPEEVGFFGGLKAGLTDQPGSGIGHFIGAGLPATIGAGIGSLVAPGPGSVIGAELGEVGRKAIGAMVNPEAAATQSKVGLGADIIGTAIGQKAGEVSAPYIGAGIKKTGEAVADASNWFASKIGKSFLKASKSINAYGHAPEQAIKDECIIASSWDSLIDKAKAAKHDIGDAYSELFGANQDAVVNIDNAVSPINSAISEAKNYPNENKSLIKRLIGLKEDITNRINKHTSTSYDYDVPVQTTNPNQIEYWTKDLQQSINPERDVAIADKRIGPHVYNETSGPTITGSEDIPEEPIIDAVLTKTNRAMSAEQANNIKREIYGLTKYSGNPSDDAVVNKVKQYVAGRINNTVGEAVPEIKPLNTRYANLDALEKAAVNREVVASRSDVVGLREMGALGLLSSGQPFKAALLVGTRSLNHPAGATVAMKGLESGAAIAKSSANMIAPLVKGLFDKMGSATAISLLDNGIAKEKQDHPQLSDDDAKLIAAQELSKDPEFYDEP